MEAEDYIEHAGVLYYIKSFNVFNNCVHLKCLWIKTGAEDAEEES
jgi:hypothetical protein